MDLTASKNSWDLILFYLTNLYNYKRLERVWSRILKYLIGYEIICTLGYFRCFTPKFIEDLELRIEHRYKYLNSFEGQCVTKRNMNNGALDKKGSWI